MRGSLVQRYKGSWSIVLDLGYHVDPATASGTATTGSLSPRNGQRSRDTLGDPVQANNLGQRSSVMAPMQTVIPHPMANVGGMKAFRPKERRGPAEVGPGLRR